MSAAIISNTGRQPVIQRQGSGLSSGHVPIVAAPAVRNPDQRKPERIKK